MVMLTDLLMPWRLCRRFRDRRLLPWSLSDVRCSTRNLLAQAVGTTEPLVDDEDLLTDDTEEELNRMQSSVARMLSRMSGNADEVPSCPEEECVVCLTNRASLQTFPCGHMVLCRRCFVKTIKVALDDRQLPLRCIICRSRIVRLKQQYSRCRIVVHTQMYPPPLFSDEFVAATTPSSAIRCPGYC